MKCLFDLIDRDSRSVIALSRFIHATQEYAEHALAVAYEQSVANSNLIQDDSGCTFSFEDICITLVPNLDYSSPYPYYLTWQANRSRSTIPHSLDDPCVALPTERLIYLHCLMTGYTDMPTDYTINALKHSYVHARKNGNTRMNSSFLMFPTRLQSLEGQDITAGIRYNHITEKWELHYIGHRPTLPCSNELLEFAEFPGVLFLRDVASLARTENWDFSDSKGEYTILLNYLNYTFHKIKLEDKLIVSQDKTFTAFNTGLTTADYDDIYMCFRKRSTGWIYAGVCAAARGRLGQELLTRLDQLPEIATYIRDGRDVLYESVKELHVDYGHIVCERAYRFPEQLLPSGYKDSKSLLLQVRNSEELRTKLTSALQTAVHRTLKALRRNYKLAIPCYDIQRDTMSMLLPMDLLGTGTPQAALVVRTTDAGNYIGATLLSMDQAYLDARLVGSQENSWLIVQT